MSDDKFSPNLVWEQTLDKGAYQARVERLNKYKGQLIVTKVVDGTVLLNEEVGLAYGSIFGPDVDDVAFWQEKTIAAVDSQ